MRRSLFLVVILITLASLYPWRLRERPLGSDPLTLLLRSWPAERSRVLPRDVAVNLIGYVPVGALAYLALRPSASRWTSAAGTLGLALAFSGVLEVAQLFVRSGVGSALDVILKAVGAAVGVAAARAFEHVCRR